MKRYLVTVIILSAFTSFFAKPSAAQGGYGKKIAELLTRMPAKNAEQAEKNMTAIAEMGEKGLLEMTTMLVAPGKGDNTELEYALSGFSYYVTKPGRKAWKDWSAAAYIHALEKADKGNKAFIIRQLQLVGNDDAVASLQTYLNDEQLCDPAARALVKINTALANKALLNALKSSMGSSRLTLTEALGDIHYRESAPVIAPLVTNSDKKLAKLALYALAHIADPVSETVLATAASKSGYTYDETGATAAYLMYAQQLAVNGKTVQAEKIANGILANARLDKQVHTRTAALKILVDIKGEKSVPLLVNAMNDKNVQYREAALKYAGSFTGNAAIALWVKKINTTVDNTVKTEIIVMLGKTANKTALPTLLQALKNKDAGIKSAAIKSAGQIGQQDALPSLLNTLKSGNASEVVSVTNAILIMKGPGVVNEVAGALPVTTNGNAKAALISILASRAADDRINEVLPLVKSEDAEVRAAAFVALKTMSKQENLPQLFVLLKDVKKPEEIKPTQEAIIAATSSMPESQRVSIILTELEQLPQERQTVFFDILAGIGGKEALKTVADAFPTGNEQTKIAVINALSGWKDSSAAVSLLQISRQDGNRDYLDASLTGFIQLIGKSPYTADQKLLMLREAMVIAKTDVQKKLILKELEKCRTYVALLFAGKFLDDAAIQHEAAYAVMKIALSDKNWYGEKVRSLLEKTISLLNGPDAEYEKQAVRKHLADLPTGEGFVSLFNEKDLTGWKGLVENPILRSKMSADTLSKKQAIADNNMRNGWLAKNGELVFGGHGDNLCTIKKYGDFEMFVDWKITKDGDAGIYLRGSPQVQIWDTARVNVGAQVGSGGLYNNATYPSKPLKLADNAIGEWNSFHIIMKGDRVTVYLNGELVVKNIILENYWDRNLPIFPVEQIELQAHGTYVAYRDLYIKEIPSVQPYVLNEEEKKDGFKVLFDGTNMNQWTGNTTDYVMEDGDMAIYPQNGGNGNIYTKEEFSDFVYRFEFQLTPGANNGIGIRAPLEGDAAYVGMEIQVLDNEADMYKDLHAYQYHGSVYGVIPAKRGFLKPVGEWNDEEITAKGSKIKVVLNGTTILDGDIDEASKNGTVDGKEHPGLKRPKGHIGFLGHGDVVKFKHMRIKY